MNLCRLLSWSVLLAAATLGMAAACSYDTDRAPPSTRSAPHLTTTDPAPETISWSEAEALISKCEVTAAMQAHSLDVWLTRRDGSRAHTVEPRIDDLFAVVRYAVSGGCDQISLATE